MAAGTGVAALATMLTTYWLYQHTAREGLWKQSGEASYVLASLVFSTGALVLCQWATQRQSALGDYFSKVGRAALPGLWMQLTVVPLVGVAVLGVHSTVVRLVAAVLTVGAVLHTLHAWAERSSRPKAVAINGSDGA